MRSFINNLFLGCLLAIVFLLPTAVSAQGGFIPCEGTSCSACDFVVLANTLVQWLMGIIAILFAVLAAVAGWNLVTSGGDSGAKTEAKTKAVNAAIGFIIVLAAWLLVDTILLTMTGTGADNWTDVQCGVQTPATIVDNPIIPGAATNAQSGQNSGYQGGVIVGGDSGGTGVTGGGTGGTGTGGTGTGGSGTGNSGPSVGDSTVGDAPYTPPSNNNDGGQGVGDSTVGDAPYQDPALDDNNATNQSGPF